MRCYVKIKCQIDIKSKDEEVVLCTLFIVINKPKFYENINLNGQANLFTGVDILQPSRSC